ncbi:MAG TPA: Rnase Y domain-containing protein [Candidatus Dormibacteraeota bacterium]|jgi:ribonuclease Y|nr:Rnase Y domain-containing protein [Candidatus Dormibacteraeota bacterium]
MEIVLAIVAVVLLAVAAAAAARGMRAARTARRSGGDAPGLPSSERSAMAQARAAAAERVAQARQDAVAAREAALEELNARRADLDAAQARLDGREREHRERRTAVDERRDTVSAARDTLEAERASLAEQSAEIVAKLEAIAALDREAASQAVLDRVEAELTSDHSGRVSRTVATRVGELVPSAKELIVHTIQRQDRSHIDSAPRTGPIALEGLSEESRTKLLDALSTVAGETGAELGIDAERNQATLRSLDPIGREVARQASLEVLERRLRAEEVPPVLLQTRTGLTRKITELGERALWEMSMAGRPELAELLGTLHYRFSYGQNALLHCEETGYLCAVLAAELRMDPADARAAGLLHDIGKAVDHDVEGSHAIIGGELLSLLGTESGIVHAVKAHHFDEEPSTDLAMLTICADAISASRPGARRDTLTTYLQRLEQLQSIATRHNGVERAFPMQAGREVRISVRPEQVPDEVVPGLCAEIAREIEAEMTYPGMIKVTVIRETSATATAS